MRPPTDPRRRLVALLVVLACLGAVPAAARAPYGEGEEIEVAGTVTDASGRPVADVTVVLEASRVAWTFRAMNPRERGRSVVDQAERRATTDASGRFVIPWRWHDYYNRFALVAGIAARGAGGEALQELARIDLSARIRQGSPVVTHLTVPDAAPVEAASRFAEAVSTDDERRVYEQLGAPERVETFDHPAYQEVTWWYFRLGKAYRFHDGRLAQVVPFDPVKPF